MTDHTEPDDRPWIHCQALVFAQFDVLVFLGRYGGPLVEEDDPADLFDSEELGPPEGGLWWWSGFMRHGYECIEVNRRLPTPRPSYNRLTPAELSAFAQDGAMPWPMRESDLA